MIIGVFDKYKFIYMFLIGYIYTLKNPITGEVFYVGQTSDPKKRSAHHRNCINNAISRHMAKSVKYCQENKIVPEFEIYEPIYASAPVKKEIARYIRECIEHAAITDMRAWGFPLINKPKKINYSNWLMSAYAGNIAA